MVVIVSPGQNEIERIESSGVDIVPHRKRMNEEKLGEKFKDPSDPFGLVLGSLVLRTCSLSMTYT
jgi:type I restriction enzyme R subunit